MGDLVPFAKKGQQPVVPEGFVCVVTTEAENFQSYCPYGSLQVIHNHRGEQNRFFLRNGEFVVVFEGLSDSALRVAKRITNFSGIPIIEPLK